MQDITTALVTLVQEVNRMATAANAPKARPKDVPNPDPFDGTPSKLRDFKTQLTHVFESSPTHYVEPAATNRILYTLSLMKTGTAADWSRAYSLERELRKARQNFVEDDWNTFWAQIESQFRNFHEKEDAIRELFATKQGYNQPVEEYLHFVDLRKQISRLGDDTIIYIFKMNMRQSLVEKIMLETPMPTTYQDWKSRAIAHDQAWRNWDASRRQNQGGKPGPNRQQAQQPRRFQFERNPQIVQRPADPPAWAPKRTGSGTTFGGQGQPMDIDRARRQGLCFGCGERGHLKRDCPHNHQKVRQVEVPDPRDEEIRMLQAQLKTFEEARAHFQQA